MADAPDKLALVDRLGVAVEQASSGAWRAARIEQSRGSLRVSLAPKSLRLEVRKAEHEGPAYRRVQGFAFAYRSEGRLAKPVLARLDAVIVALAKELDVSGFDLDLDLLRTRAELDVGFPTPYHYYHLHEERPLADEVVEQYRRDGHVLVRRALNPDVIRAAFPVLSGALQRAWPHDQLPVDERPDAYSQSFTQITDLGTADPVVRVFSNLRRIIGMCAQLMGVPSVRLFCEDWLIKEPGARITPWHQDAAVFPFEFEATITAWIPLRDVAEGEGLLRFVRGAQQRGLADIEGINDESEAGYAAIIEQYGDIIDQLPPVFVGDVSFHDGTMIHGAFPNPGGEHRPVLALHCFAEGATIKHELTQEMQQTMAGAAPNLRGGDLAHSEHWPLVYGPGAAGAPRVPLVGAPAGTRRIDAIVLPGGEPRTIIIERGLLKVAPFEGSEPPRRYLISGLVEAHGHISYPHERDDPVSELRWMNPRRLDYAETGVTLIRDMGATDDEICKLLDAPGLPRVQATGNMILRIAEWPFTPTEPPQLVEACVARIEAGARWVKIFSDFSDDYTGHLDPGFTQRDVVTYPLELMRQAADEVHARGGRLGAHCFSRAGAEVAILAGIDTLEHGWGVDEELLDMMLERGIAWAPLAGISRVMWDTARESGDPARQQWLRDTMELLARMLPLAEQRGLTLLAGTDQFPAVTVADEILQLHALGVSREGALAAGSWAARAYLNESPLVTGAPADLVVYGGDPREDLRVLERPELILIGGKRIEPSGSKTRPHFEPFTRAACV